jgi:putative restriction endonuclease
MVSESPHDRRIRIAAFDWLKNQVEFHGDVLPRSVLEEGFVFGETRVTLVGPSGIWKPKAISSIPLSISTIYEGPYDDSFSDEGLLLYKYRGINPNHRDNAGLRNAMAKRVPLIYFHSIVKGRYLAVWPIFIVGDDPSRYTFTVAVDEARFANPGVEKDWDDLRVAENGKDEARRAYITTVVRQRLHQRSFRERVLRAYREQCSLCRLRHLELLEVAHIIPDGEPGGDPVVPNGISLCKLHHAAFDKYILGIRPDYQVEIREDILRETDGPMLQHGLQDLHGRSIIVPRKEGLRPNPDLLLRRFQRFRQAS